VPRTEYGQRFVMLAALMVAQTLWLEITIAGAVYVAGILFFVMAWFRAGTFDNLVALKEYLAFIAVLLVGCSYIVGIVMHRLIQVIAGPILGFVERLFRLQGLARAPAQEGAGTHYDDLVEIWQTGSERLHRELDFQFALVALFRSLMFALPFLITAIIVWLSSMGYPGQAVVVFVLVPLWLLTYVAYRRQRSQFRDMQQAAVLGIRKHAARK